MKTKQKSELVNSFSVRKKAKQVLALTLAVLIGNPITGYSFSASAKKMEIINAFAEISSEITTQQLTVGADESEINLPNALDVTISVEKPTVEDASTVGNSGKELLKELESVDDNITTEGGAKVGADSNEISVDVNATASSISRELEATKEQLKELETTEDSKSLERLETDENSEKAQQKDVDGAENNDAAESKAILNSDNGEIPLDVNATASAVSGNLESAELEHLAIPEINSKEHILTDIKWKINAERSSSAKFDSASAGAIFYYELIIPNGYILKHDVNLPQIQVQIKEAVKWTFDQSKIIDGIEINVKAERDVFAKGAILNVKKVTQIEDQEKIQEAINREVQEKDTTKTVEKLVSFDITITDADGKELQPDNSKGEVIVSFAQLSMVKETTEPTKELKVFHMDDSLSEAKGLETTVNEETESVEATAEHFTVYTAAMLKSTATDGEASITDSAGNVTYYDSIKTAVETALTMKNATVTLLKDINTYVFTVDLRGSFTLDLNGKNWNNALSLDAGINKGFQNVHIVDSVGSGRLNTLKLDMRSSAKLSGGSYGKIDLSGFVHSSVTLESILDEGYAYIDNSGRVKTDNPDGPNVIKNVSVRRQFKVEKNGKVSYCRTIEEVTAIDGGDITLLENVVIDKGASFRGGWWTVDFNGKTWHSGTGLNFENCTSVRLKDSSNLKTGGVISTGEYAVYIKNTTTNLYGATIFEGNYQGAIGGLYGEMPKPIEGPLNIQGGIFRGTTTNELIALNLYGFKDNVNISGGKFEHKVMLYGAYTKLSGGDFASIQTLKTESNALSALLGPYHNSRYCYELKDGTKTNGTGANYIEGVKVVLSPIIGQPTIGDSPYNNNLNDDDFPHTFTARVNRADFAQSKPITYQWYINNRLQDEKVKIEGATGDSYTAQLSDFQRMESKYYYCEISCDNYKIMSRHSSITLQKKQIDRVELKVFDAETNEEIINGASNANTKVYFTVKVYDTDNALVTEGDVMILYGGNSAGKGIYDSDLGCFKSATSELHSGTHSFYARYGGINYVEKKSSVVSFKTKKVAQNRLNLSGNTFPEIKYGSTDFQIRISASNTTFYPDPQYKFEVIENEGVFDISNEKIESNQSVRNYTADAKIKGIGKVTFKVTKLGTEFYEDVSATLTYTVVKADAPTISLDNYSDYKRYNTQPIAVPTSEEITLKGAEYADVEFIWYQKSVSSENKLESAPKYPGEYVLVAVVPETALRKGKTVQKNITIGFAFKAPHPDTWTINESEGRYFDYNAWHKSVKVFCKGFLFSHNLEGPYIENFIFDEGNHATFYMKMASEHVYDKMTLHQKTIKVDYGPPVFTAENDGINLGNYNFKHVAKETETEELSFNTYHNGENNIQISAKDMASGIDKYYCYIDTNPLSKKPKTIKELEFQYQSKNFKLVSMVNLPQEGRFVIYAYAQDVAGNRSEFIRTDGIVVDKTTPTLTVTAPSSADIQDISAKAKAQLTKAGRIIYVIKTSEQIGITAQNILDDADKNTVSVAEGQESSEFDLAISGLTGNTTYYIYAVGKDNAGNNSEVESISFKTTKSKPVFNENPTIIGKYGQQVKDMTVSQVASTNSIAGSWSVSSTDRPLVGTAKAYDVVFTPDNVDQCVSVTVQVIPTVNPKNLTDTGVTIETISVHSTYDGTAKIPTVPVRDNEANIEAYDYEYSYSDNINAGTAMLTITGKRNYTGSVSRTFNIAKATAPDIDFPATSGIIYGQKLSESALIGGSTKYGSFMWTDGNIIPNVKNSGYEVTFTPNAGIVANYEAITNTTEMVDITVVKATPTITLSADISDDIESRKATLTATVNGEGETPTGSVKFVNSTSGSDVDIAGVAAVAISAGKVTYTWTGLANQTYKVKAVYSGSNNYNAVTSEEISFDTNKQNQAALTIESIGTKTYGDDEFNLSAKGGSVSGAASFTSSDPTIVSISGNTAKIHKSGTVTITATKAANSIYKKVTTSVELTVGKKAVTIKANDQLNIIKGDVMPKLTHTVIGLVNGDTFTKLNISASAVDTNTVGEYDITISGGKLSNADSYEVTYIKGKMTIINANHAVKVTNGTGSGSFREGQLVTITAESRDGYTFANWSSSDGVVFANSAASTTTFKMPNKAVKVLANYSKNNSDNGGGSSSGGNSGGSSSGGNNESSSSPGNSGSSNTTPSTDKQNVIRQNEIKVDESGNILVSIADKNINDAYNKLLAEAKRNGNESNGITLVLNVNTVSKSANSLTMNLSKTVQGTIINKEIVGAVVVVDDLDIKIGMDLNTIKEINNQANADVNITATKKDNSELTGSAKTVIGNRPAFEFKVNYGSGKEVTSFGTGSVAVEIPYTLGVNEKAENVQAVYIDANGKIKWIENSVYDRVEQVIRFSTNTFSTYGIGYKTNNAAFTDTENHWGKENIEFVVSRGLFSGTSSSTFSPNIAMTRGMFVTALGRLAEADISNYTNSSFSDIKADAYYMGYVEWANKNGIVKGNSDGKFVSEQSITREQMAVVMLNYADSIGVNLSKVNTETKFADNDKISTYAKDAVKAMQMAGVISGKDDNKFDPQGTATRAEVSTVFKRFIELIVENDKK